MDNRETLKALVEQIKAYQEECIDSGGAWDETSRDTANKAVEALPALEALLQEPSVPVSELEALIRYGAETYSWTGGSVDAVPCSSIRSLINRSHK